MSVTKWLFGLRQFYQLRLGELLVRAKGMRLYGGVLCVSLKREGTRGLNDHPIEPHVIMLKRLRRCVSGRGRR
jgi:hypothetical protein